MARKPMGKKLRFEVFKRDSFTCQYCGKQAPDVVLHVDHINPVANKGDNDIINLITSCIDCNLGKGARLLDDNSMLAKQREQLTELNERREQMKLMLSWETGLKKLADEETSAIESTLFDGYERSFTEVGKSNISKLIKKYGFDLVHDSAIASRSQYITEESDECFQKAFNYVGRICAVKAKESANPHISKLHYIRGIVRNRMYCNDWKCLQLLEEAYSAGVSIDVLTEIARESRNWTGWQSWMEEVTS